MSQQVFTSSSLSHELSDDSTLIPQNTVDQPLLNPQRNVLIGDGSQALTNTNSGFQTLYLNTPASLSQLMPSLGIIDSGSNSPLSPSPLILTSNPPLYSATDSACVSFFPQSEVPDQILDQENIVEMQSGDLLATAMNLSQVQSALDGGSSRDNEIDPDSFFLESPNKKLQSTEVKTNEISFKNDSNIPSTKLQQIKSSSEELDINPIMRENSVSLHSISIIERATPGGVVDEAQIGTLQQTENTDWIYMNGDSSEEHVKSLMDTYAETHAFKGDEDAGEAKKKESPILEESKTKEIIPPLENQCSNVDTKEYTEDGVPVEYSENDFVWEIYLEETGSIAVPPTAFKHVECSLQSGFTKGMKLEVPNKCNEDTYWVASVMNTCGPLLRLRYDGYDGDGSTDFWCDLMTSEVHPVGWCAQNDQTLQPPEAIKDKYEDWSVFLVKSLTGARTAPSYLLDKTTGSTPIDQIKQGMRLEIQNLFDHTTIWFVKVIENVGGRLYLRYEGTDTASGDFWLFFLHPRLHPLGWGREIGYSYKPPLVIEDQKSEQDWMQIEVAVFNDEESSLLPADVFTDQKEIPTHSFEEGQKLEALNPKTRNQISPATVIKVFDDKYFLVEIDDLVDNDKVERTRIDCTVNTATIFPMHWCQSKGIHLQPPRGWNKPDLNWSEYLEYCSATAASDSCFEMEVPEHEFSRGCKLEAVNPENQNQISAATITKIIDGLMWIHIDSGNTVVSSHIEPVNSLNLFPVGWCESNGYQLKPPRRSGFARGRPPHKRLAAFQPDISSCQPRDSKAINFLKNSSAEGKEWCPKIYFNHKCFSGPFLSKGRIAELPKSVGPGPMSLVMKEVLTMLINVAYKSSRVLKEIQVEGKTNPNLQQQILKAKYKGKSYRASVEICRTVDQLEEFCRQTCIKLDSCPNLISPHFVNGNCPENCTQMTKTKYTDYYGKKKNKVGRPPGGHTNLENGPKKTGKRKRKKSNLIHRKSHSNAPDGSSKDDDKNCELSDSKTNDSNDLLDDIKDDVKPMSTFSPMGKRRYKHHLPPPSEIQTRGAKLPKYSFERKTHKKIMLPEHKSSEVNKAAVTAKVPPKVKSPPREYIQEDTLKLDSNPLYWSVAETVKFIKSTDSAHLAREFKEQQIDGQAFLLLTLPTVQEYLDLKLGPAIKLCHHIEQVKIAFFEQYAK